VTGTGVCCLDSLQQLTGTRDTDIFTGDLFKIPQCLCCRKASRILIKLFFVNSDRV